MGSWIILFSQGLTLHAQEHRFPVEPAKILLTWNYEELVRQLGEGEEIIATMYGQEYLSGYRYSQDWLGKNAKIEYYFGEDRIDRFMVIITHPEVIITNKADPSEWNDPLKRDSILQAKKREDSIWNEYIRANPDKVADLKNAALDITAQRKLRMQMDSLRSDSLMQQISMIMGAPLTRDSTPPNDTKFLFFATWIDQGYLCSYRDYNTYTEIGFSLSPLSSRVAGLYNLEDNTLVLEKKTLPVKKEMVTIQLLGSREKSNPSEFTQIFLLIEGQSSGMFLETLDCFGDAKNIPKMEPIDLTGDQISEVLVLAYGTESANCTRAFVYSLAYGEPILLFEPHNEPIDIPSNLYQGKHPEIVPQGCLDSISFEKRKEDGRFDFITTYPLNKEESDGQSRYLKVIWKNKKELWEASGFSIVSE